MIPDPWSKLRDKTPARIALGRAGGSLPTAELLAFAADHADARDAVYSELDIQSLIDSLKTLQLPILSLRSRATDRETYLKRPDLGRRLDGKSAAAVSSTATSDVDVALIVADGLSAVAVERHAASVLTQLVPLLRDRHFSVGPICVVAQARVAVQDEIGSLLHARAAVILIGERPGLGSADSLGAYLVHGPSIGNTDAERNCISNIRAGQLSPPAAANALAWLIEQALVRQVSGVDLKDDREPSLISALNPRPISLSTPRIEAEVRRRYLDDAAPPWDEEDPRQDFGSSALPFFITAFDHEDVPELRARWIRVIWKFRDPIALPTLARALRDPADNVWKDALDGIVAIGGTAARSVLNEEKAKITGNLAQAEKLEWIVEAMQQVQDGF